MTRPDTATKLATDVSTMFDEVSPRYDLLNDVLSAGNSRLWRIAATKAVAPRKGMRILDLAAGTGTSAAALAAHGAQVVAADFSEGMLAEGRRRHGGNELIEFVHADATALPFDDDSFDAATISYGLRNVSDPKRAIAEMRRVVKPGGRIVIAEFSTPPSQAVRVPYGAYGRHVLPRLAGLINRSAADAYRYLNESIEQWPSQEELAAWLNDAGLERVAYRNLTFGIVALHRGFVPQAPPVEQIVEQTPAARKPAARKPAAKKPAAKKPAADAPAKAPSKAAAAKPATKDLAKPAASKPTAAKKPAAAKTPAKSTAKPTAKPAAKAPAKPAAKPAAKPTSKAPAKPAPKTQAGSKTQATPKTQPAKRSSEKSDGGAE